jgi:hypothetical protein
MWNKIAALVMPTSRKRASNPSPDEGSCSANQAQHDESASEEAIRLRAYQKWEAAGKPDGDGRRFWLQAVHEILQGK